MNEGITLTERIDLMTRLGEYMRANSENWQAAKEAAARANAWFTPEHIELAAANIAEEFLQKEKLAAWVTGYSLPSTTCTVGVVMAGNIPMVGFHDFLCSFISGHKLMLKLSSKDEVLMKHIINWLVTQNPALYSHVAIADRLNGCDAYIATGSNNTARYFEQYFGKYPNVIRRNRTSVAILEGNETDDELAALADDIYQYYGLGCRNVTQICVPRDFDFARLLNVLGKYNHYADLNKYKNNYDYHLAIYLLNRVPYMSNESLLLVENDMPFSAVSVLHYRYYSTHEEMAATLMANPDIQAIMGRGFVPFGNGQKPALDDYADGIDTMSFLCGL